MPRIPMSERLRHSDDDRFPVIADPSRGWLWSDLLPAAKAAIAAGAMV